MTKKILALIVGGFLAGCGGGGGSGSDNGNQQHGGQQSNIGTSHLFGNVENFNVGNSVMDYTISPDGKYIYAVTLDTSSKSKLHVFSRNIESGKLTKIQSLVSTDFVNGKDPLFNPQGMVVSPDGKQLYISASFGIVSDVVVPFGSTLLRFDVANSGQISYRNSMIVKDSYDPMYNVQMTDDGKMMYIGSNGALVSAVSRASNGDMGGILEIQKDINNNEFKNTRYLFLSPDNQNLYASSSSSDGHLYNFNIAASGGLTSKESFAITNGNSLPNDIEVASTGGRGMDISKDGKFFYSVGGFGDAKDSITIFERDALGGLTYIKNVQAPLSSDNAHHILFSSDAHMMVSPSQKYIYTYDEIMNTLGIWKRDTSSGDLNYLGQLNDVDSNHPTKLTASPDGKYLYVNAQEGFISYDLRADMDVKVTSSDVSVKPSQTFSYKLTVQNHGPSNGNDVIITDTLPAGVEYISSTIDAPAGSCEAIGQVVTCHIDTLFTSALYHVTINVKAPASEGTLTNKATISANQLDTNVANNSSLVKINVKNK